MDVSSSKPFLDLLGIDVPIVQAPMAGVSTAVMAAAVANAGALGSIGVGAVDADGARRMIAAFRDLSERSLNVNVFCHAPAKADAAAEAAWIERLRPHFERFGADPPATLSEIYKSFVQDDDMLAVLLADRPRVVSFHFGLPPTERIRALHDAGILLLGCATNLQEARLNVAAGVVAIIAQGYEAGGHRGMFDPDGDDEQLDTMTLTRLIARELDVRVIAAGGIMNGDGIATALRSGASAAQLGTAFVACPESQADAGYRAALTSDASRRTVMTRAISGRPARSIANRFTALGASVAAHHIPSYPIAYDAGKALNAAAKTGNEAGFGAQWAGTNAAFVRTLPAAELISQLAAELERA